MNNTDILYVLMSVYNEQEKILRQAVESILNQTYKNYIFFIVLDAPQNTKAKNILYGYAHNDNRIKIIENDQNRGLVYSLNKLINMCDADNGYFARMDADDIAEADRFEKQLKYLQTHDLDLIGCELRRIDGEGNVINRRTNKSYPSDWIEKILLVDDCVAHPSWFGKVEILKKLNGYRDIYSCEDYDFLLRAIRYGYRIGICDEILLSYRINNNGISRNNALRQLIISEYLKKNYERIDEIDINEIEIYVEKHVDKKSSERYEKANCFFNEGLERVKRKRYVDVWLVLKALIFSKYILVNICKILKVHCIRSRYEGRK